MDKTPWQLTWACGSLCGQMFRLLEKINLLKNNKKKKKKKTPGGSSLGSCWLHLPIYPFPNNRCGGKHCQLEAAPQVASTLKRRHFCVLRRGAVFQLRLCLQTFQPARKKNKWRLRCFPYCSFSAWVDATMTLTITGSCCVFLLVHKGELIKIG